LKVFNDLADNNGTATRIGMLMATNRVCREPRKNEADRVPVPPSIEMMAIAAQVGHEVKRPLKAPIPPNQPILTFLVRNERAKLAKLAFRPTSHEIEKRRSRLTGMKSSPRC
jgi:hypothetical protein